MNQTKDIGSEWVFIVLHSEALFFQVLAKPLRRKPRKARWARVALKVIRAGRTLYTLVT